ncbi:MAG: molybdopterin molybdenumtransferase MoeA, partial [Pseudomonadota bacterium]
MLSVDEALEHILAETAQDKSSEALGVGDAFGRVLAADAIAATTQPPFDASAMDGYAVRFSDAAAAGGRLKLIGECRAGEAFSSPVAAGEAVRIFTGGVVPDGADHIVIQEDTEADGETVTVSAEQVRPR